MKISVNWLKQFTDIDMSVDELVAKIGAQLGAVEEVTDLGKKYQGIIVSKVISAEKHPNADKLSVCWVDDGGKAENVERNEAGHVQVVCGAPNVRAGLTVAWLPPGATVPSSFDKEPFVLGARELRGAVSNGMLASAAELAIGDDHNGIVELDIDADPGTDFAELYELNDHIIDIENKMFTHRPDCFGILGVAREIAGITGRPFISPDWYASPLARIKPGKSALPLTVKNDILGQVPRFMAIAMADVTMGPSPFIIQTYLSRVGIRPISNVVDVTNYLMVLTGQPTHAYDYDKLNNASLETRMSRKGDKLKLLSGKELEFDDEGTILITSGDVPVGVGGVMGGADTEVGPETKNIVVECANFDMYSIRKTSMKYGLFTDAVTRFNKGQSSLQNDVILEEAVATLQYVTGAHVASDVFDIKAGPAEQAAVEVTAEFINVRLGSDLATEDIARILENVEFNVEVHADVLKVTPPYWRTDIEIAEDIVEEVGRLHGYDSLPVVLPKRSIKAAQPNDLLAIKSKVRSILSRAGANEVLTYSFVHGNLLERAGQDAAKAYSLTNAISPDLQYYRMSLAPSLLDRVHPNIKSGYDEFALFEIGKVHVKGLFDAVDQELPGEAERVALVFAADDKVAKQSYEGAPYYQAVRYLDELMQSLKINYTIEAADQEISREEVKQLVASFDQKRHGSVMVNGESIGYVAEPSAATRKALKLPSFVALLELDTKQLLKFAGGESAYRPISRFPKVQQDISLRVNSDQTFAEVLSVIDEALAGQVDSQVYYNLSPLDIYQKDDNRHITLRLEIASFAKTMVSAEVNNLLDRAAESAKAKLGAERL